MASSTSSNVKLELMADGENDSTWGQKTNTNLQILEKAVAGVASVSTTGGSTTLDDVDYTADDAKASLIDVTGTLTSNATIVIPNRAKTYKVFNRTTGAYTVSVKTASGSAVVVTQASSVELWCDGSNTVRFIGPITDFTTGAPNTSSGAAASTVSVTPDGDLTSTNVQSALVELQGDIDDIEADLLANYQPLDADLTQISGLSPTKGNLIAGTGSWSALGVGTNGFALIADSASSAGMKWAALLPAGTDMLFYQASAPTGWTATAINDRALRVVNAGGTGGSTGGTTAFSSVFSARTIAANQLPNMTLTVTDPGHSHEYDRATGTRFEQGEVSPYFWQNVTANTSTETTGISVAIDNTARGGVAQQTIDFAVQYADVIVAAKDAY